MTSFNKVILLGNLTRDPELRVTPAGHNICKLGLAATRVYYTQDGNKNEETVFVDIDAFGKQAETIARYMSKGRPILIEGRLRLDTWETSSGDKRSKLCVVAERFQFIGGRGESNGGSGTDYETHTPPKRPPEAAPPPHPEQTTGEENAEDDVPF